MKYIRSHARHVVFLLVLFIAAAGMTACGGGSAGSAGSAAASGTGSSLSGVGV